MTYNTSSILYGYNMGRPKGSRNKVTDAQADLLAAWDKVSGPVTAIKLMKSALSEAIEGREIIRYDKEGNEVGRQLVKDFGPIHGLMPFFARKMPTTVETPDLGPCTADEIAVLDSWWMNARKNLEPKTNLPNGARLAPKPETVAKDDETPEAQ